MGPFQVQLRTSHDAAVHLVNHPEQAVKYEVIRLTTGLSIRAIFPALEDIESDQLKSLKVILAEKSEPLSLVPREEWPERVRLGDLLKWGSSLVEIDLYVELPFWLLVEPSAYTVTLGPCSLQLSIIQDAVEVQYGKRYRNSHSNARSFHEITEPLIQQLDKVKDNSLNYRVLRTVIKIRTKCLDDAITAAGDKEERRRQEAAHYFQSLVFGHFDFVNRLLVAYALTAEDAFSYELSEWDLPFWFVNRGQSWIPVSLMPYFTYDQMPFVRDWDGNRQAIALTNPESIKKALRTRPAPGRLEALDAWSLFYRGRYTDAVRLLATSVEVSLENAIVKELQAKNKSQKEIEKRLAETFNDFDARLDDYVNLSGRRVPGPIIAPIPYINGVRLRVEIERNRKLRHKVVHEGIRITKGLEGAMLRAVETSVWFVKWLHGWKEDEIMRQQARSILPVLRGKPMHNWTYTAEGVTLLSPSKEDMTDDEVLQHLQREILRRQFVSSIDGETRDLEFFIRMFFCYLDCDYIESAPAEPPGCPHAHERYQIWSDVAKEAVPIFYFDVPGMPSIEHLQSVAARLLSRMNEGRKNSQALCVFNYQNTLPWQVRNDAFLGDKAVAFARQCGIAMVSTADMVRTVEAMMAYKWDFRPILHSLFQSGRSLTSPPGFERVGVVNRLYPAQRALSVSVDPGKEIRKDDTLLVRLWHKYHQQAVDSLALNKTMVEAVQGPNNAGIGTTLTKNEVNDGEIVFVRRYADAPDKRPVPFYDDMPNNIFYDHPVEEPTPAAAAPPAAAVSTPTAPSEVEIEKAIKQLIAAKMAAATAKGSKECFVNAGEIAKALGDDGQIPKICKAMCDLYNEETDTALHIPPKKQGSAMSFKYKIPRQ